MRPRPAANPSTAGRGGLLRGGLWAGSTSVVQSVCRLISVPLALAFLSVEEYGTWVLAFVFLQYAGLSTVGFPPAYQRFTARYWRSDPEQFARHVATVFWSAVVVLGAILGIVLLAAPMLVERAIDDPGRHDTLLALVRVVAVTYFLEQILGVFSSVLLGVERYRQQSVAQIAGEVANLTVQIALFLQGWDLLALAWAYALAALVRSGLCAFDVLRCVPGFRLGWRWFTPRLLGTVWGYGGMMQVLVAVGGVLESLPRVAAGAIAGLAGAGLVHIAQRIPNQVTGVVAACLVPLMSRAARIGGPSSAVGGRGGRESRDEGRKKDRGGRGQGRRHAEPASTCLDRNPTRELLLAGTRALAGLTLPMAAALVALAPQVITGWLGRAEHDVVLPMRLFALAYFVNLLTGPATQVLRGQGRLLYELAKMCIAGGVTLVWYLGMPREWGLAGLSGGFLGGMVLGTAYLFGALDRRLAPGGPRLAGVLVRPAVRSLVAGGATVLVLDALGFGGPVSRGGALAGLGIGGGVFVAAYALVALATLEAWERGIIAGTAGRLLAGVRRAPRAPVADRVSEVSRCETMV